MRSFEETIHKRGSLDSHSPVWEQIRAGRDNRRKTMSKTVGFSLSWKGACLFRLGAMELGQK